MLDYDIELYQGAYRAVIFECGTGVTVATLSLCGNALQATIMAESYIEERNLHGEDQIPR
jgi:hypothetical protein